MASESWEKVKVKDLKIGDRVQVMAFVDLNPATITLINIEGGIACFTTDQPFQYQGWNPENMVFRVKGGDGE